MNPLRAPTSSHSTSRPSLHRWALPRPRSGPVRTSSPSPLTASDRVLPKAPDPGRAPARPPDDSRERSPRRPVAPATDTFRKEVVRNSATGLATASFNRGM
jgi:hypothetical protein